MGGDMRNLKPPMEWQSYKFVYQWEYLDHMGRLLGYTARYENEEGKKKVIPFFDHDEKGLISKGPNKPTPLYGLNLLTPENKDRQILVVEGEKCARALQSLGFIAVTWLGGTNRCNDADWSPLSGFKKALLLPDDDSSGIKAMDQVMERVMDLEHPPHVIQIRIPDLKPKEDIVNVIQELKPEWDGYRDFSKEEISELKPKIEEIIKKEMSKSKHANLTPSVIDSTTKKIRGYNLDEYLTMNIETPEYLVGGWFPLGAPLMICGAPKSGKSFFAYHLGYSISQSFQIFHWSCPKSRKVLYFDGEMRPPTIQQRLMRQAEALPYEYPESFTIYSRESFTMNNILPPDLSEEKGREMILSLSKGADVVILDNVNTWFRGGNENDPRFWQPVEEFTFALRDMGVTSIIVHHTPKSSPKSPAGSSKAERIPETILVLERVSENASDGAHFNIRFHNMRDFSNDCYNFSAKLTENLYGKQCWETGSYIDLEQHINKGKYSGEDWHEVFKLKTAGKSYREIAEITGIPSSTIGDRFLKEKD